MFKCHKVTLFVVDKQIESRLVESICQDKGKYVHDIEHFDTYEGSKKQIKAISRT